MGYLHINNLYKDDRIFKFDECYALEKIHGTSAHIKYTVKEGLTFFSGGEKHSNFVALWDEVDQENLLTKLASFEQPEIIVFGEAYGGKQQGMKETYGDQLKFVAFDVQMNGLWLDVPNAETLVKFLKLEFVDYNRGPATLTFLDQQRDLPSTQAKRNGITDSKKREGIVIRPIGEINDNRGNRIITKHKNVEFMETKTPRVVNPDKQVVLAEAQKIADEWVTDMRLQHVLDRAQVLKNEAGDVSGFGVEDTGQIIGLMLEDVKREAAKEIVESKAAFSAIGRRTSQLFQKYLAKQLNSLDMEKSI